MSGKTDWWQMSELSKIGAMANRDAPTLKGPSPRRDQSGQSGREYADPYIQIVSR